MSRDITWPAGSCGALAERHAAAAPSVTVDQVIEHGLRHLASLVLDDAVIAGRLGNSWAEVLAEYHPEPFQALS